VSDHASNDTGPEGPTPTAPGRRRNRRNLRWTVPALLVLLIVPAYVRAYRVHGPSEAPSYVWGEIILVNRAAYDLRLPYTRLTLLSHGDPRPGDVILIRSPGRDHDVIRRVVGLPGDTVEVRRSRVVLNGVELGYRPRDAVDFAGLAEENRIGETVEQEHGAGPAHPITYTPGGCSLADAGPFEVPDGHYFLLGDNRDHCTDSRRVGPVPRQHIRGRVIGKLRRLSPTPP